MVTRKFTSVATSPTTADVDVDAVSTQPMFSNPVLTRRAQKSAISGWAMLAPLGVLAVAGAGYWAYTQMTPTPITTPPAQVAQVQTPVPAQPMPAPALGRDGSAEASGRAGLGDARHGTRLLSPHAVAREERAADHPRGRPSPRRQRRRRRCERHQRRPGAGRDAGPRHRGARAGRIGPAGKRDAGAQRNAGDHGAAGEPVLISR